MNCDADFNFFPMKLLKIKYILFCWVLVVISSGCNTNIEITEKVELPSSDIYSIVVDNNGIKWITTKKGVVSYDGVKLTNYTEEELSNAGDVNRLFSEKNQKNNRLYLCSNNGLSIFEHGDEVITDFITYSTGQSGILSDSVLSVDIDSRNNKYIATSVGLSIFSDNKWFNYFGQAGNRMLQNYRISAVAAAKNNWIYVSTKGGGVSRLKYLDGVSGATTFTHEWASGLKSDNVLTVIIADDTCQWYGTDKGVAFHENEHTKSGWTYYSREDGLICDTVTAIAKDMSGNLWFGTPKGLSKLYDNKWENFTMKNGLVSNCVKTIAVDLDGSVWIGTDNGISHFKNNVWANFEYSKN